MKKIAFILSAVLILFSSTAISGNDDGHSIQIIDGNLSLEFFSQKGKSSTIGDVYRLCIAGQEFVVIRDGHQNNIIQVFVSQGFAKVCKVK